MTRTPRRAKTIIPPDWWLVEARRLKEERGLTNHELAPLVARALRSDPIEVSRLSRCLTGDTSPIDLVYGISSVLGIPPPVFFADTIEEAHHLVSAG